MSYSFSVRAADKESAKKAVADQLAEVVRQQPVHARDVELAQSNVDRAVDTLKDVPDHDVVVSAHGSIYAVGDDVMSVNVSCNVYVAPREVPEAKKG